MVSESDSTCSLFLEGATSESTTFFLCLWMSNKDGAESDSTGFLLGLFMPFSDCAESDSTGFLLGLFKLFADGAESDYPDSRFLDLCMSTKDGAR